MISEIEINLPARLADHKINRSFANDFISTKIPSIYTSNSISSAINIFSEDPMVSEGFNEIYEPFISGLYKNNGFLDTRNYSNSLKIIEESDMEAHTKTELETAIVITYASARLWDPHSFLQSAVK